MNRDFATQWDIERDMREEAAHREFVIDAPHRLKQVKDLAKEMMKGYVANKSARKSLGEGFNVRRFGLNFCAYTESDEFARIESILANGQLPEVSLAVSDLRKLMLEYCEIEAAAYYGYDLEDLESCA